MAQLSAKLELLLRNFPALQFVVATIAGLLRKRQVNAKSGGCWAPTFSKASESDGRFGNAIGGNDIFGDSARISHCQSEREKLIRRRWMETGIKMWNPDVHGSGSAALNIQGQQGVLPIKQGQALPSYDELKFKLVGNRIVCEAVVVDPPSAIKRTASKRAPHGGDSPRNAVGVRALSPIPHL
jgi:hypothetical protein